MWNPDGKLHVSGGHDAPQSRKRVSTGGDGPPDAIEITRSEQDPAGPAELKAIPGNEHALEFEFGIAGMQLVVTPNSECWIYNSKNSDDVVETDACLMLVYGIYKLDAEADAAIATKQAFLFALTAESLVEAESSKNAASGPYPSGVATFGEFCSWLLAELKVTPTLECHNVTAIDDVAATAAAGSPLFKVDANKSCAYLPQSAPANASNPHQYAGSILMMAKEGKNFDPVTGKHVQGHLVLQHRPKYQASRQFSGIVPAKPGIYLQNNLKVRAGTVYKLG